MQKSFNPDTLKSIIEISSLRIIRKSHFPSCIFAGCRSTKMKTTPFQEARCPGMSMHMRIAILSMKSTFRICNFLELQSVINHMRFKENLSYSSCKKVKNLLSLMYKYAIKTNICQTNYALLLSIGHNHPVYPHHVMSRQKINRLWSSLDDTPGADTVLILLYTGLRVSEMLNMLKVEVNLRHKYLRVTHAKTASGVRVIPIHPRILPIISQRMTMPGPNLICDSSGRPYEYSRYRSVVWQRVIKCIRGEMHTPHDTRHTFATLLDNADANENAKRKILGHATGDVTDRVYTHKSIRQLRKCIELLK